MSFASETKNELARVIPEKKCCQLADIAGFMRIAGSIGLVGGGKFKFSMSTPNLAVVRHYKQLLKEYFEVDVSIEMGQGSRIEKSNLYTITLRADEMTEQILREVGILMVREGKNSFSDGVYDGIIKTKCCRKSYLRGAFLAGGTVNNPEKGYHFEIKTNSERVARDIRRICNSFTDISAKVVPRKKGYGVYIKAREQVRDMIAIMGASNQFFEFDNVMMLKDLMSQTRRENNLDNANIDKALRTAEHQIRCIKAIEKKQGLESLSAKLREAAEARLAHPELGIAELGQIMDPPLSKSGINNRLRRITEMAESLPGGIE
ncbi:MAG: DNA-binding protein WhiA [Firmicutes bacterium]|nr:DNA-binding protein WhiA [Bacillota bacterium]